MYCNLNNVIMLQNKMDYIKNFIYSRICALFIGHVSTICIIYNVEWDEKANTNYYFPNFGTEIDQIMKCLQVTR
jgi:hypothetical protein